MSDTTLTFDGIEFDAESIIDAINENLTDDHDAYEGENTTGLTITDDYVIVGDGCDDPDATVACIETEESVVVSLTTLREEAEEKIEEENEFKNYLREHRYVYEANDVVDPDDTPVGTCDAVIKHDRSTSTRDPELVNAEVNGIENDENLSFGPIQADGEGVLYVGIKDERQ